MPRRERLCCDKNWGILELPPAVDTPPLLHIIYTMLPCLTVFTFNASALSGADFKSAQCLTDAHSNLVQRETGLDMHDVRISGHPIVSQRESDGQPSELMVLVHHSWRKHGGAAHWAATVDPRTWQVSSWSVCSPMQCMWCGLGGPLNARVLFGVLLVEAIGSAFWRSALVGPHECGVLAERLQGLPACIAALLCCSTLPWRSCVGNAAAWLQPCPC